MATRFPSIAAFVTGAAWHRLASTIWGAGQCRPDEVLQLMEAPDRALLDQWTDQWSDLVDFEVVLVMTSPEAAARVTPHLSVSELP